jgi:hypothetical protein
VDEVVAGEFARGLFGVGEAGGVSGDARRRALGTRGAHEQRRGAIQEERVADQEGRGADQDRGDADQERGEVEGGDGEGRRRVGWDVGEVASEADGTTSSRRKMVRQLVGIEGRMR